MLGRSINAQFRKPDGLLGRLIGAGMARHNAAAARWTVDLLELQPELRVLEIGFGPGVALQYAAARLPRGRVSGVDYSATMLGAARRRNRAALRSGSLDLTRGDVAALPYAADTFDRAFAIHCLYFWAEPLACLRELRRVLRPGGLLALTIQPKDAWSPKHAPPTDIFRLYHGSEVAQLAAAAGFRSATVHVFPRPRQARGECIRAWK